MNRKSVTVDARPSTTAPVPTKRRPPRSAFTTETSLERYARRFQALPNIEAFRALPEEDQFKQSQDDWAILEHITLQDAIRLSQRRDKNARKQLNATTVAAAICHDKRWKAVDHGLIPLSIPPSIQASIELALKLSRATESPHREDRPHGIRDEAQQTEPASEF